MSQFSTKRKSKNGDESAGDWIDTSAADETDEDDELDDEDIEAAMEMDKDRQASDEAEIQDLAREVDDDM